MTLHYPANHYLTLSAYNVDLNTLREVVPPRIGFSHRQPAKRVTVGRIFYNDEWLLAVAQWRSPSEYDTPGPSPQLPPDVHDAVRTGVWRGRHTQHVRTLADIATHTHIQQGEEPIFSQNDLGPYFITSEMRLLRNVARYDALRRYGQQAVDTATYPFRAFATSTSATLQALSNWRNHPPPGVPVTY